MNNIRELLNKKKIYSSFSNHLVTFVEHIDAVSSDDQGVYSDGIVMIDNIANAEDDVQQMYCELKHGGTLCMEDFYADYGCFSDKEELLFNNIAELIADR